MFVLDCGCAFHDCVPMSHLHEYICVICGLDMFLTAIVVLKPQADFNMACFALSCASRGDARQ